MGPAEFKQRQAAGVPVRVVASREAFRAASGGIRVSEFPSNIKVEGNRAGNPRG